MTVLTEDALTWYSVDDEPGPGLELLVETMDAYVVMHSSQPWPSGAFRWAALPPRLLSR